MKRNEIDERVIKVFEDFFDEKEIVISVDTTVEDLDGWDSVAHIQLIFEVEEAFGILFDAEEIPGLTSVRKIADRVEALAGSVKE